MGKFDGFLLASDWDGTLFYKGAIPEKNLKAILHLQKHIQTEDHTFTSTLFKLTHYYYKVRYINQTDTRINPTTLNKYAVG